MGKQKVTFFFSFLPWANKTTCFYFTSTKNVLQAMSRFLSLENALKPVMSRFDRFEQQKIFLLNNQHMV